MVTTTARAEGLDVSSLRDLAGPAAVVRAALSGERPPWERLARNLGVLARQSGALALRGALLLAWIRQQDLADLGYATFGAFVAEHVDSSASWERALRALVESPLDKIKAALCQGLVTVRAAVQAPGKVAVDEQEAWLARQVMGTEDEPEEGPFTWIDGERGMLVRRAQRMARLLLGRDATDHEVNEHVLRWWRDRVPPGTLLAMAFAPRDAPPTVQLDWDWVSEGDPAEPLLGPWVEPTSLHEAAERLEVVQGLQRSRRSLLAHGWTILDRERGWEQLGYASADAFAADVLEWSSSTARRYRRLGQRLDWHPDVRRAVDDWLELERAEALIPVLDGAHDARWLAVVRRVGRKELGRAVRAAREGDATLQRYERAIALADAWDVARVAEGEDGARSSDGGEEEGRSSAGGEEDDRSAAGGPELRVALPMAAPSTRSLRRPMRVPIGLVEAERWLLETVHVPAQRGFGKVKERDRYQCQNPECGRIGLRSHAHHEHPRSEGGSDNPSNGITLCPVCHLRLVHARGPDGRPRLTVRSVVVGGLRALLWTWYDGRQVLQFREGPR